MLDGAVADAALASHDNAPGFATAGDVGEGGEGTDGHVGDSTVSGVSRGGARDLFKKFARQAFGRREGNPSMPIDDAPDAPGSSCGSWADDGACQGANTGDDGAAGDEEPAGTAGSN